MNFLKVVASIACGVLLLIFLNNLMGVIFPSIQSESPYSSIYSGGSSAYDKCNGLQPKYDTNDYTKITSGDSTAYEKCLRESEQAANDKKALAMQKAWIRAIVVLVLLVIGSVLLFRSFPFFSSSLIAAGFLFALTHPYLTSGTLPFFGYSGDNLSEAVQHQVTVTKLILSAIGFIALTAADILFFEKHHKETLRQDMPAANGSSLI